MIERKVTEVKNLITNTNTISISDNEKSSITEKIIPNPPSSLMLPDTDMDGEKEDEKQN